jgi:hypothetical protein
MQTEFWNTVYEKQNTVMKNEKKQMCATSDKASHCFRHCFFHLIILDFENLVLGFFLILDTCTFFKFVLLVSIKKNFLVSSGRIVV